MMRITEETDLHKKQRYARELNALVARFDRLDDTAVRSIVALLQDLRRNIAAALLDNPTDFELWRLTGLQRSVEEQIATFQAQATEALKQSLQDAASIGVDMVDKPIGAALGVTFNALPPQVVNIAADFSAMLITQISDDLRNTINTQLRLGILGQKSPFLLMKDITNTMGVFAYDGVWGTRRRPDVVRGVAARAETIVRTENTRMLNLAQQARAEQVAKDVPGLLKRWIATGDSRTRPAHLAAHAETYRNPIPVAQSFEVGGELLTQPGDPMGSAGNTINCRCRVVMVVPSIGVIDTPEDIRIRGEVAKRAA